MKNNKGFTLLELMYVVAIIGILAAIAIPQFSKFRSKAYRVEAMSLADDARKNVVEFYDYTGRLPKNNEEAGLAAPGLIQGKYVDSVTVENGTITVHYRERKSEGEPELEYVLIPGINEENKTGYIVWERRKDA